MLLNKYLSISLLLCNFANIAGHLQQDEGACFHSISFRPSNMWFRHIY